jgi:hypothetical protein
LAVLEFINFSLFFSVLLIWLVIAMLLAPLEALGWWAGWFEGDEDLSPEPEPGDRPVEKDFVQGYLVFLTGISGVSGDVFLEEEEDLLERVDSALGDIVVVKDVYPYSVTNTALTGQRVFARFWRFAQQMKLSGKPRRALIGFLINIRNGFQVAVSADRRYGPIYNTGSARMIERALLRNGYKRGSGMPVTLLGYSGGGQIAVGAVPYLKKLLDAPVVVISLGGVISADPGVLEVERLYHLYGSRDGVQRIGWIMSPSRWHIGEVNILPLSRWNRARREGRIRFIQMGNMKHNGEQGYLSTTQRTSDGNTYIEATVAQIVDLIEGQGIGKRDTLETYRVVLDS